MRIKTLLLLITIVYISIQSQAQNVWRHRACLPGTPHGDNTIFVIGDNTYVVGGSLPDYTVVADVWEYNLQTDTWTQKNNFPTIINGASSFVINDTAYVGIGSGSATGPPYYNAFYRYDQVSDQWIPIASFPGTARYLAMSFVLNGQGYVVLGKSVTFTPDSWAYNPSTDSWTQIADFPGQARQKTYGLAAGGMGYVGLGRGLNYSFYTDNYQYNPITNTWLQIANFPATERNDEAGFTIHDTIYVAAGNNDTVTFSDCWAYDRVSNSWIEEPGFSCVATDMNAYPGFTLNGHGYILEEFGTALLEFGPVDTAFTSQVNVLGNDTTICGAFNRQFYVYDSCAAWSTGEIGSSINISAPGTYWVRLNDSCGVSSDTVVIMQTSLPIGDSIENAMCGSSTGSIGVFALGGGGPYKYAWTNGDSTAIITHLSKGLYSVTVTDISGCSSTLTASVDSSAGSRLPPPVIDIYGDTLACLNTQGIQWYYDSVAISGANSYFVIAATAGTYSVIVTDSSGCTASSSIEYEPSGILPIHAADGNIVVYPNPLSQGSLTIQVNSDLIGSKLEIFDSKGSGIGRFDLVNTITNLNLNLSSGVYLIKVLTDRNAYISKLIKL